MRTSRETAQANRSAARQEVVDRIRTRTRGAFWPRGQRRLLAIGYLVAVGVAALGALIPGPAGALTTLLGVFAVASLLLVLRRATRLVADAPDAALDELMVRLRGECFVMAYQLLAGACSFIAVVLLIGGSHGMSAQRAAGCGFVLLGLTLGLPVVVVALTLPDVDPQDAPHAPPRTDGAAAPDVNRATVPDSDGAVTRVEPEGEVT